MTVKFEDKRATANALLGFIPLVPLELGRLDTKGVLKRLLLKIDRTPDLSFSYLFLSLYNKIIMDRA